MPSSVPALSREFSASSKAFCRGRVGKISVPKLRGAGPPCDIWNIPYMWDELGFFWDEKFTDPINVRPRNSGPAHPRSPWRILFRTHKHWGEFRESCEPLLKGWESLQPSSLHSKFGKRIWYGKGCSRDESHGYKVWDSNLHKLE